MILSEQIKKSKRKGAVENPINRIYIRENGDHYEVRMEFSINNNHVNSGYPDYKRRIADVKISDYIKRKEDADEIQQQLCELFGITIEIKKSKLKPVTFVDMVTEE